ncbi:MAG: DEAD/DEAH box helicase [Sulfuriferula sp.]
MSFASLGLNESLIKALEDSGYTQATPIQEQAIPMILEGHDLLASAQTGTGKTAAFMLPALEKLSTPSPIAARGPRVLVLTPTRELALQVTAAAQKYGSHLRRVKVVSVLGGMPYPVQNKMLSQPYEVLVATPGRLIDHIERGRIDFSRLELLILDEADRMLDMGFFDDVERIAMATPATRQTVMFSATFEGNIARLATQLLKSPKRIEVAHQQARHENITQHMHYVDDLSHKNRVLTHLVNDTDINQAIIFTATKRDADSLADDLQAAGHKVAALHGDMHQGARNRTITQMRHGSIRLLVATDVAARGLDVPGITHVINYDLPKNPEDYVHRIGRTGRAGASGIAVSLASPRDSMQLKRIERFTGQLIPAQVIDGLEPKLKPRTGSAPSGGRPGNGNGGGAGRGGRPAGGGGGYGEQRRSNSGGGYGGQRNDGGRSQSGYGNREQSGFANREQSGFANRDQTSFANREQPVERAAPPREANGNTWNNNNAAPAAPRREHSSAPRPAGNGGGARRDGQGAGGGYKGGNASRGGSSGNGNGGGRSWS